MNKKAANTDPGESLVPAAPIPTPVRSLTSKSQPSLDDAQATPAAAAPEQASLPPKRGDPKPTTSAKKLTRQERYMLLI